MLEIIAAAVGGFSIGVVGGVAYFFALAKNDYLTTVEPRKPDSYPWVHKKRLTRYGIVGLARAQCSTKEIEDGELLVLYRERVTGAYSVRPQEEFHDGRFAMVFPGDDR